MFHHGWPLSADDWDAQMLFFLDQGYRVIAHDRRGHGRSTPGRRRPRHGPLRRRRRGRRPSISTCANAVHVGHSTGGGEVARYVARHGQGRVAKLVLIGAVPPLMVKTPANPGGLPIEVFDGFRTAWPPTAPSSTSMSPPAPSTASTGPARSRSQAVIDNWWRQGMMGGAKAHYDGIKAFSETDFTDDLKAIEVPTLVMHGDDDQIVPYADAAPAVGEAPEERHPEDLRKFPHGMCTTHADVINPDLLAFIKG